MSIRWDPILASALARELDERLARARVRALLLDAEARRVHLFLRDGVLVFELHPTTGWVSLLEPADPLPGARPLAARIRGVRALPDESAMVLGLQRVRGRDEGVELFVEWIGNRWNAAVVGHRTRTIRHVLVPREERTRSLLVGRTYEPPPSTSREGVEEPLSPDRWRTIVRKAGDDAAERRRAVLRNVAWTSSLNVDGLLEPDGYERWLALRDPAAWGAYVVRLARGSGKAQRAPQPYPLPLAVPDPPPPPQLASGSPDRAPPPSDPGTPASPIAEPARTLLAAMAASREQVQGAPARSLLLPARLVERTEERVRSLEGRVRGLRRELERTRDPGPLRATGDLILARYGEIPSGASTAVLTGFDGAPVEVELDPALPPHENAKRHYDEAARIERARAELPGRIQQAEDRLEEWRALAEGLAAGRTDPAEVERRLGPDPRARAAMHAKGPGAKATAPPYRSFRSSGGHEIRVGRGARANDALTFHHSAPDDIWLHARQAPGAHVILRWQGEGSPPRADLVEAAVLAALHSEARHSGSVPVDWTRRKYVRKPRKAPPGAVTPDRVETLLVEPDPDLPGRLARGDE